MKLNPEDMRWLIAQLETKELSVEWQILSEVGPGWIGGGRTVTFFLDDAPLGETPLHRALQARLVALLQIPDEGGDVLMEGEGEFSRKEGDLVLDFEWSHAVPYSNPHKREGGTEVFLTLSTDP